MDAILLVGHGSRDPEGNEELLEFAEMVRREAPRYKIETCFLEFEQPDIARGIASCVEQGAARVVIIPVMLFAAGHAKVHIPFEMDRAKERYPGVEFAYGRPIGVHRKVMDILTSRVALAGFKTGSPELPIAQSFREPETAVLLIGRGSSDGDANGDFFKMTRLLWEQLPVKWVENCFIGVTEPTFEDGLERVLRLGAKKIFVLPYFLFTGILIKRIEDMTAKFAALHPDISVELAGYFGFHPKLVEALLDRVAEAVEGQAVMNCSLCQHRLAAGHDHHHHHDHGHDDHHHNHHDHDHHDHDHEHEHHHNHDHHLHNHT
ncbi:sirohydrochlorin cobaltochelatase [Paenibacillus forsythiae]|uniref:Sirohydrochlorin cobaltochelatase n=1 Tax=Paenibacillus forsythiae TaxID=365616 RepID=A0ABU3HDN5_9BACL|nr:sirohydrochlorin chelatase [Paenibacillus forsythiae]MDT3428916.1 sirohydrochlorin cobaltochelatase [Paenibacillus forsythiae]